MDSKGIIKALESYTRRPKRATQLMRLTQKAKSTYPYPPNPFCSSEVSASLVEKALTEAGYKDFQLFVSPDGIYIEPKFRRRY